MTVYTDLRTAIVARLNTVSNVGQVHNRPRWNADWSKFLDHFKTTVGGKSTLLGWWVSRESAQSDVSVSDFNNVTRIETFILTGIQAFVDNDDSYANLQALCDTIMADLDNQSTLSVTGVQVHAVGPCSLRSFGEQMLGSVLAHVCEIEVPIMVTLPFGTA